MLLESGGTNLKQDHLIKMMMQIKIFTKNTFKIILIFQFVLLGKMVEAQNVDSCIFVIELENTSLDIFTGEDTGSTIISDTSYIYYKAISCEGDIYVQERGIESNVILSEGCYKGSEDRDTVNVNIVDPGNLSVIETNQEIFIESNKIGLWLYYGENGDVIKKVFYFPNKERRTISE